MKKIFRVLILLSGITLKAQNLSEVKEYSKFIGLTFRDFEINYKKTAVEKESNFGIETNAYKFEKYAVILQEGDDGKITKISFIPTNYKTSNIVWYDNVKEIRQDDEFKFIKSFINDEQSDFYSGDMKYIELIDKLREINDVERIEIEIVFKKHGLYYSYLLFKNKLNIQISNKTTFE